GVQTCALPISGVTQIHSSSVRSGPREPPRAVGPWQTPQRPAPVKTVRPSAMSSGVTVTAAAAPAPPAAAGAPSVVAAGAQLAARISATGARALVALRISIGSSPGVEEGGAEADREARSGGRWGRSRATDMPPVARSSPGVIGCQESWRETPRFGAGGSLRLIALGYRLLLVQRSDIARHCADLLVVQARTSHRRHRSGVLPRLRGPGTDLLLQLGDEILLGVLDPEPLAVRQVRPQRGTLPILPVAGKADARTVEDLLSLCDQL